MALGCLALGLRLLRLGLGLWAAGLPPPLLRLGGAPRGPLKLGVAGALGCCSLGLLWLLGLLGPLDCPPPQAWRLLGLEAPPRDTSDPRAGGAPLAYYYYLTN